MTATGNSMCKGAEEFNSLFLFGKDVEEGAMMDVLEKSQLLTMGHL